MKASVITDPDEFLTATADLFSDEARNDLVLGIAGVMKADPDAYPEGHMPIVEHDGLPILAAECRRIACIGQWPRRTHENGDSHWSRLHAA